MIFRLLVLVKLTHWTYWIYWVIFIKLRCVQVIINLRIWRFIRTFLKILIRLKISMFHKVIRLLKIIEFRWWFEWRFGFMLGGGRSFLWIVYVRRLKMFVMMKLWLFEGIMVIEWLFDPLILKRKTFIESIRFRYKLPLLYLNLQSLNYFL